MSELPFQLEILAGRPPYEQVVQAVHRAIALGQLKAGDPFPSVRALSKAAQINPNTAHKVVQALVREGDLEVLPGRGTRVTEVKARPLGECQSMLTPALSELIIEAKRIGVSQAELTSLLKEHWKKLSPPKP